MNHVACILAPAGCAVGALAKSTFADLFNAWTSWILASVQWLFNACGRVLTSLSDPRLVLRATAGPFAALEVVSPALLAVGLMTSTLHALRLAEPARLWREYFGVLPACVAGVVLARPLALLVLEAVNQMSSAASSGVVASEHQLVLGVTNLTANVPGFGLFVIAGGLAIGTWLLWCELLVRDVLLALLLVTVPLLVPLATFTSLRRVGWRLLETFVAVAASKLVIVVTLVLGLAEVHGNGAIGVVTGLVTLVLAAASPFVILRVVPIVEHSALHAVEGLRGRAARGGASVSSSPYAHAVEYLRPDVGPPTPPPRGPDLGLEMWPGSPEATVPEYDGEPVPPPIGTPRSVGGRRHVSEDEMGPVIGWHFDE
ncbi:MAG: hypothetical protein KGI14_02655 [Acidobacteriota bacterium]|nr:hypothetical protein [Acidobacteriota bacterium]